MESMKWVTKYVDFVVEGTGTRLYTKENMDENILQTFSMVYICVPVSESASASARLAACIEHLEQWMKVNRLKLNTNKTQLIWLGTRQQIIKLTASHLQLAASSVPFDDTVRNLLLCWTVG